MLSHHFHLKPTPSWPALITLNSLLAMVSYFGGLSVFLKTVLVIGLFLFFKAKVQSFDGYVRRFMLILFLALLFWPYVVPQSWQSPLLVFLEWGFIPALLILVWAIDYASMKMRPESHVVTPYATVIAPLDSMRMPLYVSTILFSLAYTISLRLIVTMFTSSWHWGQWIVSALLVGFTILCALAHQDTLTKQQRIDAQGGEWMRIDSTGIQMQSWHNPNIDNGLKQGCMQQEFFPWQDIVMFDYAKDGAVAAIKSKPPHYENRTLYIPLVAPFYNLNELFEYLQQMKQKFG
ncbi:hypothetical protein [Vitreoscilla stercoraria]|uniref:Uncharacterized protein n=1 Tax=Vitreoscilla stercoraria TaxID=61 RepID=A0ABY4EBL7_VITST|nr:hypothetical protein [Vitreoscilla stercoraria]UOO93146.1 hypothetical protein LVJ81_03690 [Vitreoscilla stercoraria]